MRAWLVSILLAGCGQTHEEQPFSLGEVQVVRQSAVESLDVLFVIDDTVSMQEKAELVEHGVAALVARISSDEPELDVHVGFITTSLGSYGADTCAGDPANSVAEKNDAAHLLGFLDWAPWASESKAFENSAAEVAALAYDGCGFEAPLEAWYRFLVDPAPPAKVKVVDGLAYAEGIDEVLLEQRDDFLRPRSAVWIVMLSDENDCSVDYGGQGWLALRAGNPDGTPFSLPPGTSACAYNPLSPCCRSCAADESEPPDGCTPIADDLRCQPDAFFADVLPLRCFDQKRRFGVDFLYSTRRYVEALTQQGLANDAGELFVNPLFAERDPSLVFFTVIGGVPWQDIVSESSLNDPEVVETLPGSQLEFSSRFDWLTPECLERGADGVCDVWDPKSGPQDPLLRESVDSRAGKNPPTGTPLVGAFGGYLEQPINGHERFTSIDLQYSCISPLLQPIDCTNVDGCPCKNELGVTHDPVCQTPSGEYSNIQSFSRAYPPTRQLEVLRDFGANGTVASLCPKFSDLPSEDPRSAFNSTFDSIANRFMPAENLVCVSGHEKRCRVFVDATRLDQCGCEAPGFRSVSSEEEHAVRKVLEENELCGQLNVSADTPCGSVCICALESTKGAPDEACRAGEYGPVEAGFCTFENYCASGSALRIVGIGATYTLVVACE